MQVNEEETRKFYSQLPQTMQRVRLQAGRPLTLTEKIIFAHGHHQCAEKGTTVQFSVDHLAMDDAAAQVALLQFSRSKEKNTAISTTVHCDLMVVAENGAEQDIIRACEENGEIINFLQSASGKYGLDFWEPGSGIMHHQLFDYYAFPGGMMLATDPYAPYVGGLGMLAFEGNGVQVLDLMTGFPCERDFPRLIGVHLFGALQGWASAKDIALTMMKVLTVSGAKGAVIEYFGKGAESISCSGKGILCSMGAEMGAISSIFPYDASMAEFLGASGRGDVAMLANQLKQDLQADLAVIENPANFYDHVIEFDLSTIEPQVSGPFSTEKGCSLSELSSLVLHHGYPEKLSLALIGSTSSSYEDLKKAALIARHALKHGLKARIPLFFSPGSEQIKDKLLEEGLWKVLEDVGAVPLAGARGPCEGHWKRHDTPFGEKNSILTSYNRASLGLYDGNPGTHTFIASPEIVMVLALAGSLNFNPCEDALLSPQGLPVRLSVPKVKRFAPDHVNPELKLKGYLPAVENGLLFQFTFDPSSERLQPFEYLEPPFEKAFTDLRLLIKVSGKCSTEQISPGGKWLKYRGHLGNISNNLFSLSPNEFRDEVGRGRNLLTGSIEPFAKVAKDYKKEEIGWIVVAREGYGEGPYNDHAALTIRFLGGKAVIAQSIDPMHETILKKQGLLALTFAWPENVDKIREDDLIDLLGVQEFAVGHPLELLLKHADGTTERLKLNHSYTEDQVGWFKAGGFLSYCL